MPRSLHDRARTGLQYIRMAETGREPGAAFHSFVETHSVKYERAVEWLAEDKDEFMSLYAFPAKHRKHIRISNPIECFSSTVRNRTWKTRNA